MQTHRTHAAITSTAHVSNRFEALQYLPRQRMTGRSNAPHSFRQRCCFPATAAFACHEPATRSGTAFLLYIVHTLFELESGSKTTAEFKLQRFKKHQKGSKFQLNLKFQKKPPLLQNYVTFILVCSCDFCLASFVVLVSSFSYAFRFVNHE